MNPEISSATIPLRSHNQARFLATSAWRRTCLQPVRLLDGTGAHRVPFRCSRL
jgi:hypothetical protein